MPADGLVGMDLTLQNENIFAATHEHAERVSELFPQLHPILARKADGLYDAELSGAFRRGVSLYEIVASFDPVIHREFTTHAGRVAVAKTCQTVSQLSHEQIIDAAEQNLHSAEVDTPRLVGFGREVLGRHFADPSVLQFGMVGLAAARQWHATAAYDEESLVIRRSEVEV